MILPSRSFSLTSAGSISAWIVARRKLEPSSSAIPFTSAEIPRRVQAAPGTTC